jgi:Caspase domain
VTNDSKVAIGIVIGASRFPRSPSFDSERLAEAFSWSKHDVLRILGSFAANVLDLFDSSKSPHDQCEEIHDFLEQNREATDLIVYYVGHGGFLHDQTYFLALRKTATGREHTTGLRAGDLATTLREGFRRGRTYVILDCCFAGNAPPLFQAPLHDVIEQQMRGVAMLNASSRDKGAIVPPGSLRTMFSECLCSVLLEGIPGRGQRISLRELRDAVAERIEKQYADQPKSWPEVHSPRQQGGDVADFALFPNPVVILKAEPAGEGGTTHKASLGAIQSLPGGFLKPIAHLTSKTGDPVSPIIWQLCLELKSPYGGTKAEALQALRDAVEQDKHNAQSRIEKTEWPRVLKIPGTMRSGAGGNVVWSFAYEVGARNVCGDEHLMLAPDGSIAFQRTTFWDVERLMLDFGFLSWDSMLFSILSARYAIRLRVTEGAKITLRLYNPCVNPPTLAYFHITDSLADGYVSNPSLGQSLVKAQRAMDESIVHNRKSLAAFCKGLLDGVANEFLAEGSGAHGTMPFLTIKAEAAERLSEQLVPTLDPDPKAKVSVEAELTLDYSALLAEAKLHRYELVATLKNVGKRRLDDWCLEVEFPTDMLPPGVVFVSRVRTSSDGKISIFRMESKRSDRPQLLVGDTFRLPIPYVMDDGLYGRRDEIFQLPVRARAYVDGMIVCETTRLAREFQNF